MGILLTTCPSPATAGVFLSVANTTINAGQSGIIDVFIHKEVGDADWNILLAGYSFSITPNVGAVGSLEFDDSQPDIEQSDARYLFSAFQPTGNFSGFASCVFQYDGGGVECVVTRDVRQFLQASLLVL